jgi:AcrR family transcriptional regulator
MRTRDEQKEEAIREKAIQMVVEDGMDGLSMQKLAKAAGVSPATIYIYYKDREDLLMQLYIRLTNKMFDHTTHDFTPEMHFDEGMKILWHNRANYFLAYPFEMLFLEQCHHSPIHDRCINQEGNPFRSLKTVMQPFVKNAILRHELVPLPFEAYWSIAWAPLYQLLKFHFQGRNHVNEHFTITDEIIDLTLQLVLKALKPQEP